MCSKEEINFLDDYGLVGFEDSAAKFAEILRHLGNLRESVKTRGPKGKNVGFLCVVYGGRSPGLAGATLMAALEKCLDQSKKEDADQENGNREELLRQLDTEIASFEKLAKHHKGNEEEEAGPRVDTYLLPTAEDSDRILRYETTLERHFERKLQQLVSWRRAKAEAVPPEIRTS